MYSMCILTFAKLHNTAKKEILRQPSCVFGRHFPAQARVFPLGFQGITGPEVMWIARSARKAFRPLWSSGPCGSGSRAGAGPSCGGSLNDRTCDRRRMHHRSAFGAPIPLVKPGQDTVKGLRAPVVYTRISQRGLVGSCSTLVGKTGSDDDVPSKKKKPTPKTTPSDSDSGGATTTHAFQAETKRLLDIVTNSLYTDKEVFVRELVSNASDALEKCRHFYLANGEDPGLLTVDIKTNEADGTFTIVDTGLGMTKSDLQNNLGVIARSGSKEFVETLSGGGGDSSGSVAESTKNIIGKFGVGFYSAFMVAEKGTSCVSQIRHTLFDHTILTLFWQNSKVDVYSSIGDGVGHKWSSTGDGKYTISQCAIGDGENESPTRGTKITLQIKESDKQLAVSSWAVESVLKKYSAFVSFPVMLNDKKTNAIEALWRRKENEVTDEDATAFYRFIGTNASVTDNFAFRLHFSADAPLTVRALLFAPTDNPERGFGGSQSGNNNESGVSLYSRRVLIQQNARNVLPSFLRFVRGVIDCEDVPLNISRETLQDSALVKKLGEIISKRVIKWLTEKAKKEPEKYNAWYAKLGVFLKEGVCGDESYLYKDLLVPLLRFESTNVVSNKDDKVSKDKDNAGNNTKDETKKQTASVTSLDEYVARMPAHQSEIYYLVATGGRKQAERSPYLEAMHARGFEGTCWAFPKSRHTVYGPCLTV